MSEDIHEVAAWLRSQAEADLAAAEAATPGPWEFEGDDPTDDELYSTRDEGRLPTVAWTRDRAVANGRHMERHDPLTEAARAESVLAVLDAYDGAVRRHEAEQSDYRDWVAGRAPVVRPEFPGPDPKLIPGLAMSVRLIAFGYRHREGYKPGWAGA